jgi:hypothetical protein
VVEPQPGGRQTPALQLDAHVGAREHRGREADEGGQQGEEAVERIDVELFVQEGRRGAGRRQHLQAEPARRDQRQGAERDVRLGRPSTGAVQAEDQGPGQRRCDHQMEPHP